MFEVNMVVGLSRKFNIRSTTSAIKNPQSAVNRIFGIVK